MTRTIELLASAGNPDILRNKFIKMCLFPGAYQLFEALEPTRYKGGWDISVFRRALCD